jgi:hypothetical protein
MRENKFWEANYWSGVLEWTGPVWEEREERLQHLINGLEDNPSTSDDEIMVACTVLAKLKRQHAVVAELRKLLRPKIYIQRG